MPLLLTTAPAGAGGYVAVTDWLVRGDTSTNRPPLIRLALDQFPVEHYRLVPVPQDPAFLELLGRRTEFFGEASGTVARIARPGTSSVRTVFVPEGVSGPDDLQRMQLALLMAAHPDSVAPSHDSNPAHANDRWRIAVTALNEAQEHLIARRYQEALRSSAAIDRRLGGFCLCRSDLLCGLAHIGLAEQDSGPEPTRNARRHIEAASRLLARIPNPNPDLLITRASVALSLGDKLRAASLYRSAAKASDDPDLWLRTARLQMEIGVKNDARSSLLAAELLVRSREGQSPNPVTLAIINALRSELERR